MLRKSAIMALAILSILGLAVPAANSAPRDYSQIAKNIIPSGQKGTLPLDSTQAVMYDALTPLFNNVTNADINKYFKSEKLGVSTDGPGVPEIVPREGVTIIRDKYLVPHVTATTYNGGIWAAGWIVPTLYLSASDAVAIAAGVWHILPAQSLNLMLPVGGGLPIEEGLFFLVTSMLVTQGFLLVSAPEAAATVRGWLGAANRQHEVRA